MANKKQENKWYESEATDGCVKKIKKLLADERFTYRSYGAIKRACGVDDNRPVLQALAALLRDNVIVSRTTARLDDECSMSIMVVFALRSRVQPVDPSSN